MSPVSQPRTILVEFLGAFVRRHDGWAPVASLVGLLGELGVDEASVRTSISRLKKRGWLLPERRGAVSGYLLSEIAVHALDEGDRVIWHARTPADLDDGWALVSFSVPERERAQRHLLRSRLGSLGFGSVSGGLWIAPARMLPAVRELLDELGLSRFVDLFTARYEPGQDLEDLVRRGWDLAGLNAEYLAFLGAAEPILEGWTRSEGSDVDAFRDYMQVLNRWRTLPFRDPGLPPELLGADWSGGVAASLFEVVVSTLDEAATRHVDASWAVAGS